MSAPMPCVATADDKSLIALISAATRRVVYLAPGVSVEVAKALASKWSSLGKEAVSVMLDVDPEVFRLGYGDFEALWFLQQTARSVGAVVLQRPGVRIGLLVADDTTLVFSPAPLLIEGGSSRAERANAIVLQSVPKEVEEGLSLGEGERRGRTVGLDSVRPAQLQEVAEDLRKNPPAKFDVARVMRVFNSQIEFVELEVRNCSISRRSVRIPSDLMGLAKDPKAQALLQSSFRLVGDDTELSGERIMRLKNSIVQKYLVTLPNYGMVILRSNKPDFEREVDGLRRCIRNFQERAEARLQEEMDTNRAALVRALSPAVEASPPQRWNRILGPSPSPDRLRQMLDSELKKRFGTAKDVVNQMDVRLVFKGVTYELIGDPDFRKAVKKAFPSLDLFSEIDAAPTVSGDERKKARVK